MLPALPESRERSAKLTARTETIRDAFRRANVGRVYLLHGTFAGTDALGLLVELSRFWPDIAKRLGELHKRAVDAVAGETGNYTARYAEQLQELVTDSGAPASTDGSVQPTRIGVERFHWNGQNHHIGRADGAVHLIDHLVSHPLPPGQRVLIWAHSHAGNVLALVTNLLAADPDTRDQFFRAAWPYVLCPFRRSVNNECWTAVRTLLSRPGNPLSSTPLDLVTFGTPVRYGWDTAGYAQLMHFIHHRPVSSTSPWAGPFPPSWEDINAAAHGDLVQQYAVAGTNISPGLSQIGAHVADRRLNSLLQHGIRRFEVFAAVSRGFRMPDEGEVLLVDYREESQPIWRHLLGHAVYTRPEFLLFHLEEIVQCFYRS